MLGAGGMGKEEKGRARGKQGYADKDSRECVLCVVRLNGSRHCVNDLAGWLAWMDCWQECVLHTVWGGGQGAGLCWSYLQSCFVYVGVREYAL